MSDKEINKAHLEADKLSRQQFDLTLSGQADNAGVRKVNAADGNRDNPQHSKENKKELMGWEMLQLLQDFENDLSDMLDRLRELREEMDKLGNRINKGKAALESGNMDSITFHLMSEYNYAQDKIDGMSDEQKTEALENHMNEDELTYDQLKSEYTRIDQAIQEKLNSETFQMLSKEDQERLKREYEEESQAEIVKIDAKAGHLDRERAMTEVRIENNGNSSLLSSVVDTKKADEYDVAIEPDEFDDFSAFDEFSSSSFADTLDDGNQFAASAGSITQSFNQVGGANSVSSPSTELNNQNTNEIGEDLTQNGHSMAKGMKL